jgi:hypothetical protein
VTGRDPSTHPLSPIESIVLAHILLEMWKEEVAVSPDPGVTRED